MSKQQQRGQVVLAGDGDPRHHFTQLEQVSALVGASEAEPDMGFMARLMTLCSLPRTNPGDRQQYRRVSGPWTLAMTAGVYSKLPYGALPRLLLSWVTTEAVRTRSRVLPLGDSLAEFMRKLGLLHVGGADRRRLQEQMQRLFRSHVELHYRDERGEQTVAGQIASRTTFWWNPKRPDDRSLWESKIELSEEFFLEILRRPVPVDMNILQHIKRSSLGLDLYLWLTWKVYSVVRPIRIPWPSLYRQFGVDPAQADDTNTVNNFRTDCLRELKKIKTAWPSLHYSAKEKGVLILYPSPPSILPAQRSLLE